MRAGRGSGRARQVRAEDVKRKQDQAIHCYGRTEDKANNSDRVRTMAGLGSE